MAASPSPSCAIISLLLFASLRAAPPPPAGRQVASAVIDPDGQGEGFFLGHRQVEMVGRGQILKWARHKRTRSYGLDHLLSRFKFSGWLGHIPGLECRN
jgi:hypothetical protein